ncbi:hypothetical protein D9619_010363 [Psilocybe cf. subviscida]|uniref:Uncharacterized protein n=1 Tax=Psilocybe cf. subviscida TaxID=2480587 RepID=A0A8H5AS31_9AGAR|nr:hypothetical protein D9619_010363 [Psilocybe cf. subviscida]
MAAERREAARGLFLCIRSVSGRLARYFGLIAMLVLTVSLVLSAALLRAIIANHVSHSESSKAAKASDASLRHKIQALEAENAKLDGDVRRRHDANDVADCKKILCFFPMLVARRRCWSIRQRTQLHQKSQETNQLRLLHTTVADSHAQSAPTTPDRHRAVSPTPAPTSAHHMRSQPTSPTPYSSGQGHYTPTSSASAAAASMTSRFNSLHQRSASMSSRPVTPAAMSYSHSQGPPPSASAAHSVRSQTPGVSSSSSSAAAAASAARRSHTPGPGHSSASASAAAAAHAAQLSSRSHTPAPSPARSQTPGVGGRYSSSSQAPPVPPMPTGASIPRYSTPAPIPPPLSASGQYTATYTTSHSHSGSLSAGGHPSMYRGSTPGPIPPPKPRRMSVSVQQDHSPPRVGRSTSEEKAHAHAQAHQRWIPTAPVVDDSEYGTPPSTGYMHEAARAKMGHMRSSSRAGYVR